MRMMMKIKMDAEAGSRAVQDGKLANAMEKMIGELQPESAYFGPEDGQRTAFIVFDMRDPSQLPSLSEPFYSSVNAKIEFFPVMNREDLQKGLQTLQAEGSRDG